jgi:hypothetical protein
MSLTQSLVWLASYPKSGNTWLRLVLANALADKRIGINEINISRLAADRTLFTEALGFNCYNLSEEELLRLRPEVYTWFSQNKRGIQYMKIHDAYFHFHNKTPIIPTECSLAVIYCIRNPLDVAVSYAHHSNISIDQSIAFLCHPHAKTHHDIHSAGRQIQQHLFSWSDHVKSWTEQCPIPVYSVRYEDMHLDPLMTFKNVFDFLKLDCSQENIQNTVTHTRFESLKTQEENENFREKSLMQKKFFRKGIVGDWKNTLSSLQIKKIIQHHEEMMLKHGYL